MNHDIPEPIAIELKRYVFDALVNEGFSEKGISDNTAAAFEHISQFLIIKMHLYQNWDVFREDLLGVFAAESGGQNARETKERRIMSIMESIKGSFRYRLAVERIQEDLRQAPGYDPTAITFHFHNAYRGWMREEIPWRSYERHFKESFKSELALHNNPASLGGDIAKSDEFRTLLKGRLLRSESAFVASQGLLRYVGPLAGYFYRPRFEPSDVIVFLQLEWRGGEEGYQEDYRWPSGRRCVRNSVATLFEMTKGLKRCPTKAELATILSALQADKETRNRLVVEDVEYHRAVREDFLSILAKKFPKTFKEPEFLAGLDLK